MMMAQQLPPEFTQRMDSRRVSVTMNGNTYRRLLASAQAESLSLSAFVRRLIVQNDQRELESQYFVFFDFQTRLSLHEMSREYSRHR